jgi:MFS transporter, DHA3 family, macrolide efflux protein
MFGGTTISPFKRIFKRRTTLTFQTRKHIKMEQPTNNTFKHYLPFWSGQIISTLGSSIVQFVIIWWITLQTQSGMYLSLAALVGLVPMIVLSPFVGVLVDRWNRKRLIAVADFAQALATLALIILFWADAASIGLVLALLAARGICQAFHTPTVLAVTPSMVPQEKLSRINGLSFFFSGAINLIGPVTAALLLEVWSINQMLWIDLATFAVAIIPLLAVKIPSVAPVASSVKTSFRREFTEGLKYIKSHRGLLPLFLLAMILNLLITPLTTLLPYFIKFDHLGAASDLALVEAMIEAGMLVGGLAMTALGVFKRKATAIAISFYVIFLGYLLIAVSPAGLFWFMGAAGLMAALFIPAVNILAATITQTVIPLDVQGRVNSVNLALVTAASPIGMVASGAIVGFVNTSYMFVGCAVAGFISISLMWMFTGLRHVESEAPKS